MEGTWVQSLFRELRSHLPLGATKKTHQETIIQVPDWPLGGTHTDLNNTAKTLKMELTLEPHTQKYVVGACVLSPAKPVTTKTEVSILFTGYK